MGECGLYLGQRELGRLTWESTGQRLRLHASCPCENGLIYRVVLQTDQGLYRLGVMLPANELFTLQREIPAELLPQRAFIDRTLPGEAHLPGLPLAFSAFSPLEEAAGMRSAYWIDTEYRLFPLQLGDDCVCASCLCLATVLEYESRLYGVFCKEEDRYRPLRSAETDRLRKRDVLL